MEDYKSWHYQATAQKNQKEHVQKEKITVKEIFFLLFS